MKHPSNYYTYKFIPDAFRTPQSSLRNQTSPLEKKVQEHLTRGHNEFFQGRYQGALQEYHTANALLHQLLHPNFPVDISVVQPSVLSGINVFDHLLDASPILARYRQIAGVDHSLVAAPSQPPDEIFAILDQFNRLGPADPRSTHYYKLAVSNIQIGEIDEAHNLLSLALDENGGDNVRLEADIHSARGVAYMQQNNLDQASTSFNQAKNLYAKLRLNGDEAVIQNNLGVAFTLTGNAKLAGEAFQLAGNHMPLGMGRTLEQPLNPGLASAMTRPMGQTGLSFLIRSWDSDDTWWTVSASAVSKKTDVQQFGVLVGEHVIPIDLRNKPQIALRQNIYEPRVKATTLRELHTFEGLAFNFVAYLAHIYGFTLPVSIGDCYHALGDYAQADNYYLRAIDYPFLNQSVEAPLLWGKMAENYVAWGDHLYKLEEINECQKIYGRLISQEGKAPENSVLYRLSAFSGPATDAKLLLDNLDAPSSVSINPAISLPILIAWSRWQYLLAGLDFYGLSLAPIFTFEYLQQASRTLAQQAIQAEREYINFITRAKAEQATRRELQNALSLAQAEMNIQAANYNAAEDDHTALVNSTTLARDRVTNARNDRDKYANAGYSEYVSRSIATAHGAGEDWHGNEIRELARDIESGSWSGDLGKLAAAATLLGGQKSYEYQLARLDNQVAEMEALVPISESQAAASAHRKEAARLSKEVAALRKSHLQDSLEAFNSEQFTPEIWSRMAMHMRNIARDYQYWAIRTAKLMERAYNFESDRELEIIRDAYSMPTTGNVLGADYLLRDIDSFTYFRIIHTNNKESEIKDVISLRNEFPFDFYEFQQTGVMNIQTSLHDFDNRHPGHYLQRLHGIEVELIGLLPSEGVQGTLRGSFISHYRDRDGSARYRFHMVDTMALSEFQLRQDGLIFRTDTNKRRLFEGNGVAGSWQLEIPRRSNNFDYRLITDVRLNFYYTAFYDPGLKDHVLQRQPLPGELIHVRDFAMRYDFPEVWYRFLKEKSLNYNLTFDYLPRNETNFAVDQLAIRLITRDGLNAENITLHVQLPDGGEHTLVTDAGGTASIDVSNQGAPLLGEWVTRVEIPDNSPLLREDGTIDSRSLLNISLVVQYQFEWQS